MAPRTTGVGIIGVNADRGWATTAHIPALQALPDYEIRALSASNESAAAAVRAKYGIDGTDADFNTLVNRPEVDLVVVTVRAPKHLELVTAALTAGKAVYCEWPLGASLQEARTMTQLAEKQKVRTIIGLQARHAPQIEYARNLIADNYIGEVLSTTMIGLQSTGATVSPANVYMMNESNGANLLTVSVGHSLDALSYVLGEFDSLTALTAVRRPVVTISGTDTLTPRTSADQVGVLGQLTSGAAASIHIHEGSAGGTGFLWEIHGTEGTLRLTADWSLPEIFPLTLSGSVGQGRIRELAIPDGYGDQSKMLAGLAGQPAYNVGRVYASFAADAAQGSHRTADFGVALGRHEVIAAIQESMASGSRVKAHARTQ